MSENFDTSFYDSIASSITSDFWEAPYQSPKEIIETPIEYTLSYNWEDNTHVNLSVTKQSLASTSSETNQSLDSSNSDKNHSITSTPELFDIPSIDDISFEQLEKLLFASPSILPCIDEHELSDVLEFIEKDLRQPVCLTQNKFIEKQYNCIACKKSFTSRPGVRKHFSTKKHKEIVAASGEPDPATMTETWTKGTYSCFVCGKSFAKYSNMIDHVITH